MQIPQGVRRNKRCAEDHAGADTGVEHPGWKYRYDARLDLDMDDAAAGALLAVMRSNSPVVERMPAVVNFNFLPDYGQNDCVMAQGRRMWLFANNPFGARASANLFSLVATARANGLEPSAHANHLFKQFPAADAVEAPEALLPWNARGALRAA